jgi:putative addiction module component (TIGR02574 family)
MLAPLLDEFKTSWSFVFPLVFLDEPVYSNYCFAMSTEQLIADALALPLAERVSIAQALWESIDAGRGNVDERTAVAEAISRDEELTSGRVAGRTHEEVMRMARQDDQIETDAHSGISS